MSVQPNFFPSYDDQLYVAETNFLSTKLIQIIIFKYFFESNDLKTCVIKLAWLSSLRETECLRRSVTC